jgi:hypothetical protein
VRRAGRWRLKLLIATVGAVGAGVCAWWVCHVVRHWQSSGDVVAVVGIAVAVVGALGVAWVQLSAGAGEERITVADTGSIPRAPSVGMSTLKTLIEALVAEVKITGPNTIVPVFRIPQPPTTPENTKAVAASPATTASERMVRTMVEPVDLLIAYSKQVDLLSGLVSTVECLRVKDTDEPQERASGRSEQAPRV